ncbi:hypothetical protein BEP19_01145 [Ammoniphilus oxalaticus]|uniref:DUF2273 domain-containing protein n=1 Tax=Ammoniphilus oxalaticus TaxID=66863 RepID=A0A419SMQ4_9BACL|nr:DUF2273 domain-containing protein [Ammoniphilus oxalaticus]RKD25580.1 hypothetical protein BEP19_01145 [Ammoniphilus oxalaticus]
MFRQLLTDHPGKSLGALAGLVFSLLYIWLGFIDTVVVLVFVSTGFYLGRKFDNREDLTDVLDRILPGKFTRF